jgi:hypothetical protein
MLTSVLASNSGCGSGVTSEALCVHYGSSSGSQQTAVQWMRHSQSSRPRSTSSVGGDTLTTFYMCVRIVNCRRLARLAQANCSLHPLNCQLEVVPRRVCFWYHVWLGHTPGGWYSDISPLLMNAQPASYVRLAAGFRILEVTAMQCLCTF